jgi:transmembrane sensor
MEALMVGHDQFQALSREGAAWVELLVSGRATEDDFAALQRWRVQSQHHAEAYAAAVKLHRLVAKRPAQAADHYELSFFEQPMTRRAVFGSAVAATVGFAAVNPPLGLWPSFAELTSDYRTRTGERRTLALSRGLLVDMNTQTSVRPYKDRSNAGIKLVSGEIAVTAKAVSGGRFFVSAGEGRVSAANASFDVRMDGSVAVATCLDGVVDVVCNGARETLKPQQQITYSDAGMSGPRTVNPSLVTAWRRGLILVEDATLDSVVAEINRYRPGKIVVANSQLGCERLSGEFRVDRIQYAVDQIQKVTHASVTALPGDILVLS